jgi:hypothetical protein
VAYQPFERCSDRYLIASLRNCSRYIDSNIGADDPARESYLASRSLYGAKGSGFGGPVQNDLDEFRRVRNKSVEIQKVVARLKICDRPERFASRSVLSCLLFVSMLSCFVYTRSALIHWRAPSNNADPRQPRWIDSL